jgi:hypothetical protein
MIICGKRANEDIVEFKVRETLEKTELSSTDAIKNVVDAVSNIE